MYCVNHMYFKSICVITFAPYDYFEFIVSKALLCVFFVQKALMHHNNGIGDLFFGASYYFTVNYKI